MVTYRNFYAVTEEDDGSITLEIQSHINGAYTDPIDLSPEDAERLAFDLIASARRQRDAAKAVSS